MTDYSDYIRTYMGLYINVFEPTIDMIDIEDIAHAGAQQPRFCGHLPKKISVNQHQVMVARRLPKHLKLAGLLHDGTESYMCDLPSPIKKRIPEYKKVEDNLMRVIAEKFGIQFPFDKQVKIVDQSMLDIERNLPPSQIWGEKRAKTEFLKMYNRLINAK